MKYHKTAETTGQSAAGGGEGGSLSVGSADAQGAKRQGSGQAEQTTHSIRIRPRFATRK